VIKRNRTLNNRNAVTDYERLRGVLLKIACLASITLAACRSLPEPRASLSEAPTLNAFVIEAVDALARDYQGLGYANQSFTHDLRFGDKGLLAASEKPHTMCVAAQLEILVEALNRYADEAKNYEAFAFLAKDSWERLRPSDFRGQVWIVGGAPSNGMSDALSNLGMGAKRPFENLHPGDFVNFNRTNGTGHAVVFLGYLDRDGNVVRSFGDTVAGFKYFSSQGKKTDGGLGYRYAFFSSFCPQSLPEGKKRDCGVLRSQSARIFSAGSAWLPTAWNRETEEAFVRAHRTRAEYEGVFDSDYFTGQTTDD
jgi:hypothetical protein